MKGPSRRSLVVVTLAFIYLAGASSFRQFVPVPRTAGSDRLEELRSEQARLGAYSDADSRAAQTKRAAIQGGLWQPAKFSAWRTEHVPVNWLVQDLGAKDLSAVRVQRYAFQRTDATARDWPQVLELAGALEAAPDVSLQSAALTVKPGYTGSREFSQCLLIAAFYFANPRPSTHP